MNNIGNMEFYSLAVPFLFFHWSINDDTCALTQAEMMVTGKDKDKTFMGRVVGPIYNMDDNVITKGFKSSLFGLWMYTQYKLGRIKLM